MNMRWWMVGLGVWALGLAAGLAQRPGTPKYSSDAAYSNAIDAVSRKEDTSISSSWKGSSAQVLSFKNGAWVETKSGNANPTATVIRRTGAKSVKIDAGQGIRPGGNGRGRSQMEMVDKLLKQAQSFQYELTDSWGKAEDIEKYAKGDCADKSFWLAAKLAEAGMASRVVCGKHPDEPIGHAWVELDIDGAPFILETTTHESPMPRERHGARYDHKFPTIGYFEKGKFVPVRDPSKDPK